MALSNWRATIAVRSDSNTYILDDCISRVLSFEGIVSDKRIVWGPPFDSIPPRSCTQVAADRVKMEELLSVAKRAEAFMQKMSGLEETKHINKDALARHFCLERVEYSQVEISLPVVGEMTWKLNRRHLTEKYARLFENVPPADLPSKKELTKRAKMLLGSLLATRCEDQGEQKSSKYSNGFEVLDQTDNANFLLAELLRGLLKAPGQIKISKILCAVVLEEAQKRAAEAHQLGHALKLPGKLLKQKCDNADLLLKHILLVESSLAHPSRLYKNVLRVILGENPTPGKFAAEPLFPPDQKPPAVKDAPKTPSVVRRINNGQKIAHVTGRSYGHRAIEQACERKIQLENVPVSKGSSSEYLWLTSAETFILSAACNHGLPVWKKDWSHLVSAENAIDHPEISWCTFGERLEKQVASALYSGRSAVALASACADQIREYKSEPETLAKKTVLMLAKLLKKISLPTSSFKSNDGLGGRVLEWFNMQVVSWSWSFQLVDEADDPLALTAVDFLDGLSREEKTEVHLVSCFDKQACRDVLGQIASVARLRSVFVFHRGDVVLAMIKEALLNLESSDDGWKEWRPNPWKTGLDDELLLRRLLYTGLHGVLKDECIVSVPVLSNYVSIPATDLFCFLLDCLCTLPTTPSHGIASEFTCERTCQ